MQPLIDVLRRIHTELKSRYLVKYSSPFHVKGYSEFLLLKCSKKWKTNLFTIVLRSHPSWEDVTGGWLPDTRYEVLSCWVCQDELLADSPIISCWSCSSCCWKCPMSELQLLLNSLNPDTDLARGEGGILNQSTFMLF